MQWAVLGITIAFLLFAWLIVQGTRAALAYRRAAAAGNLDVVRQILEDSIASWRSMKRPKEAPAEVWRGLQSMELLDFGADHARLSVLAESEYKFMDGAWRESTSPLQEGMAISAKAIDMFLYELPNLKLASVQVEVYTSFREADGSAERRCILSTLTTREVARSIDWEGSTPAEIIEAFGGDYRLGDFGRALPIEVSQVESHAQSVAQRPEPVG